MFSGLRRGVRLRKPPSCDPSEKTSHRTEQIGKSFVYPLMKILILGLFAMLMLAATSSFARRANCDDYSHWRRDTRREVRAQTRRIREDVRSQQRAVREDVRTQQRAVREETRRVHEEIRQQMRDLRRDLRETY